MEIEKPISETPFLNRGDVVCGYCGGTCELFSRTCPFCKGIGRLIRETEGIVRIFRINETEVHNSTTNKP